MSSIVYYTATSLNGYIADAHNSLDWLFAVDTVDAPNIAAFMDRMGVFVEGATTYEWVLAAENLLAEPHKWQEFYGDRPTYVFTHRQLPVPSGADVRFVSGPVADVLPAILAAAGALDVWIVGGGELAGAFHDAGALDEIVLSVAPAALSGGAPLLPRTIGPDRLSLHGVEHCGQFAMLNYRVRR